MSFLFFLVFAAAAGGLLPLLESSPGSAQELKVKVSLATFTQVFFEKTKVPGHLHRSGAAPSTPLSQSSSLVIDEFIAIGIFWAPLI